MAKIVFYSFFILMVLSCGNDQKESQTKEEVTDTITNENWPQKLKPNAKTHDIIANWPEFVSLETGFDALYIVSNSEDLSLVLDDLTEKIKVLSESTYPDTFDKAQIKSRQKVFLTYVLKTQGDIIYSIDTNSSIIQMVEAYNSLIRQMNIITDDTLDLKSLLDEE